ncbi:RyR domain containing protein [Cellulophaga phage phi40:1]|mgnify:CR=1 FL=1|uniref:RyR domain containing protein n=1 Tax=Cellulophaga phage phi38:1 TaxID=1327977 RepID=R9ZXY0_9CAUD|nr:RyR domain containing protein [Cellulophaga phage phi38:1]AGO47944.1 RyR domain containing protein [Cellulophaga phage phi40:1]AGO48109.1 RyR domain containing protein [Cellulophaga phage phi38:1]
MATAKNSKAKTTAATKAEDKVEASHKAKLKEVDNTPEKLESDRLSNIAKTCHEVNRAYCEGHNDMSQAPWEEVPDNIKNSAIDGVKFALANPKATSKSMHDNWLAFKIEDGWVYGETKDIEKKEHNCLVAYEELPLAQRVKDSLFLTVVRSFE